MAQGRSGGVVWEGERSVPGGRAQGGSHEAVVQLGFVAAPGAALKEEKLNTVTQCPQRMKAAGSSWDKPSCQGHRGTPGGRHRAKAERLGGQLACNNTHW